MRIRFGYVAIALGAPQGSPNKTITVKNFERIQDPEGRLFRLRSILRENLETTIRILRYNVAHQIHVYRFTSKTVPLATHPYTAGWDYIEEFKVQWAEIGKIIAANDLRVSAHPDHYTLLNSPQPEVLSASIRDLEYHVAMLDAMKIAAGPQLVIHIGGLYKNKVSSLERFITEFNKLPASIRFRLMLENDDKIYSTSDVLALCQTIKAPMVLDIHHHACVQSGEPLSSLWPQIIKTWNGAIPKIHLSSPKSEKDFRSHADYVNVEDFLGFLQMAKEINHDFDVMVEAKQKDLAMLKLLNDLESIPGIVRVNEATIEY
ncbi:MAG: UV DNA damage repair endonuclease UvsE [Negativicutes bacterium]|nr:UV DNA damage repair endonuclease UvsE [Negativicutes bacterium]